jgi:hypothetical protein
MTHDTNLSSAAIERDVEARRADLRGTLDELRDRMTPGQVLDEAWQFARGSGGGAYFRNLGTSVRDNPLPIALIGAGIAWLMSGRGGGLPNVSRPGFLRNEDDMYDRDELYPSASRRFPHPGRDFDRGTPDPLTSLEVDGFSKNGGSEGDGVASGLLNKARSAVEVARDAASSAGDSLSETAGHTVDSLGRARDYASERASEFGRDVGRARDYASERASEFGRDVSRRGRRFGRSAWQTGRVAQQRAVSMAEEQPVTLALAGIALGALIGAAFRSTPAESRLMGEASDRVKDQAKTLAEQGINEAAAVAERTYDAVKEEAQEQGLTTADASNIVGSVTERVKKVAEKGKAKLKEEIAATPTGSGSAKPADNDLL